MNVAERVVVVGTVVPGRVLTQPDWLTERIADMGISWGTGDSRVSGTLWWCMAASSLVDPLVGAVIAGTSLHPPALPRLALEVRPDGGIERTLPVDLEPADFARTDVEPGEVAAAYDASALRRPVDTAAAGAALRETLQQVIPVVARVSGASAASLWAIVADAIGNRALDAGDSAAGDRLAHDVAGRLPMPRFVDVGGRRFVHRISCCLVYEVPSCQMCTSCPKRPAAERESMLEDVAARS
ncbi:(2Fe-2S)-binding protein [Nocardia stercoris]|uniref:(2Fe-2S)-binding protein n=1 Tax=Nocardia stercoris TaxID=2483361 RepID=A0A3M2L0U7_9NOCA|nr:(2Fe-2S)-binding protein [Nocardia stercoris]RMI30576.1 (2Fe-2S)-binding protein [Nocardia stercoris]